MAACAHHRACGLQRAYGGSRPASGEQQQREEEGGKGDHLPWRLPVRWEPARELAGGLYTGGSAIVPVAPQAGLGLWLSPGYLLAGLGLWVVPGC